MNTGRREEPLQNFPVIRTSDPAAMEHSLIHVYGARAFDLPSADGFSARANYLQLSDIAIGYCAYGARTIVDFPEPDFARLQLTLNGRGVTTIRGFATELHERRPCVTSPGRAARLDFGAGYEQLILRVSTAALMHNLTLLLGARPKGTLEFQPALDLGHPHARGLQQMLMFLVQQLNTSAQLPDAAILQLQQAVTIGFLHASRHSFSHLLEQDSKDAAPWYVRRAEEYIEANWKQAITIAALAEVTQISARAIFKAFQRYRGYSPMDFAKGVRLTHANAMLRKPDATASVTGVAFACGFANLGHFAKDYREMFQELPSATLARARSSGPR